VLNTSAVDIVSSAMSPNPSGGKDDPQTKSVEQLAKTPSMSKEAMRAVILGRARKGGHSHRRMKQFSVQTLPVLSGKLLLSTTTGGVCSTQYGFSVLAASADWAALITLFDMVRVTCIRWSYQPIGRGQGPLQTANSLLHGPMVVSADLDATGAVAFDTLVGTRPLSDKRNHYTNSDIPDVDRKFPIGKTGVAPFSGTSAVLVPICDWMNVQNIPANPTGCLQVAVVTQSANPSSLAYGAAVVEFTCEWAYRE